jgi:glutamate synthase (ferredoxin)
MMMVVPEAWEKHQTMSDDKKAYEYNAVLWNHGMDLPLFRLLMDVIGALIDRNGLRPSRYTLTKGWFCNYGF